MSDRLIKQLLEHFANQGLTIDLLCNISETDWEMLTDPEGNCLTEYQIKGLKQAVTTYNSKTATKGPSISQTMIDELNEKQDSLERVLKAKTNEEAIRRARISEYASYTRETSAVALRSVQRMVHELSNLGSSLDICFCIDATESMSEIITSVKQCIVEVSQRISASTGMVGRFALVVYRDYCDGASRHQIWDFSDSSTLERVLGTVTARGGGDLPEDCFGGLLAAATRVSWRAPSRVIIWMGDAPQHGRKYNGGLRDDYPGGDPDGVTASKIFGTLKKREIVLFFCKQTEATNAMTAQLGIEAAPFGDGIFFEFKVEGEMSEFLVSTVHATTSRTFGGFKTGGVEKPHIISPANWTVKPPLWGDVEICKIFTFQSYACGDLHPLLDLVMDGADVKTRDERALITRNPVEKGEMRLVYCCVIKERSKELNLRRVVKESRFEGSYQNSRQALIDQAHIQAVAQFLAQQFTLKLSSLGIENKVKYVSVELLQIPSRPHGKQYFSLESFIKGTFLKFNNNNGYVNEILEAHHAILQTFSHFTYCYSRGLLMVTDIQGAAQESNYLLTDPAIHTANPKKELPDPTNLGPKGMAAFFASHTCNEFCRRLDLKLPDELDISTPLELIDEVVQLR
jgi:hypothetical protein